MRIKKYYPLNDIIKKYVKYYYLSEFDTGSLGKEYMLLKSDYLILSISKHTQMSVEKDNVIIHSAFSPNRFNLEILGQETQILVKKYYGAVTEFGIVLNQELILAFLNTYENIIVTDGVIKNFKPLRKTINESLEILFSHCTVEEKAIAIDSILLDYYHYIEINGINNIFKKNVITPYA